MIDQIETTPDSQILELQSQLVTKSKGISRVFLFLYQYLNVILVLSVIAFIAGFIYRFSTDPTSNDLAYYYPFVANFPYLYQTTYVSGLGALGSYNAYLVEYLPYFYFIFKPLSYIPDVTLFCIQCVVNTFAMIGFCRLSKRISVEFAVFMHYFTLVEAFSSGLWQNVEFVVFLIYTFEYVRIKENKKYTLIDVILIAGAGFKMYSFLFIPLYILFLSRKRWS